MTPRLFAGIAVAMVLIAQGAQAATITNNENRPHFVKVISADRQESFAIMPHDTVVIDKDLCTSGCIIVLQNGEEFEFLRDDDLIIENGMVYSNPREQGSAGESKQIRRL